MIIGFDRYAGEGYEWPPPRPTIPPEAPGGNPLLAEAERSGSFAISGGDYDITAATERIV